MCFVPVSAHKLNLVDLAESVLHDGANLRFQAAGQSMLPCINEGDVITVAPLGANLLRTGEIIAFATDQKSLVVHRLVGMTPAAVLARGDHSSCSDGPIIRDRILGRVIQIERNGRVKRWGLGSERRLLAYLSRYGVLFRLCRVWRKFKLSVTRAENYCKQSL